MTEVWDVIVIGLGPAGAMTAYLAARTGRRVLAVDRALFPRDKVCGCCVSHRALRVLQACGLKPNWSAVPLRCVQLHAGRTRVILPLPGGLVISRCQLDFALLQHAQSAGAEIRTGCEARLGECQQDARIVHLLVPSQPPQQALADLIVLADGLSGTAARRTRESPWTGQVLRRFGAACHLPPEDYWQPGTVYLAYADGEYVGITRLADGQLLLAAAWHYRSGKPRSLSQCAAQVLRRCNLPIPQGLWQAVWKGTPPFRRPGVSAGERVLAVGDAAGYIEPLTGEGITWALESAWQLGQLLTRYPAWSPELAQAWQQYLTQELARRQRWARYISRLLDHPGLTRAALMGLRMLPACGQWLIRQLHDHADASASADFSVRSRPL
jgi:flavin-dependent dehydrogenase